MNPLTWDLPTAYWSVWIFLFFLGEYLFRDGQMLSHHIWHLRNNGPSIIVFLMGAILLWLNYHFLFEGWVAAAEALGGKS